MADSQGSCYPLVAMPILLSILCVIRTARSDWMLWHLIFPVSLILGCARATFHISHGLIRTVVVEICKHKRVKFCYGVRPP